MKSMTWDLKPCQRNFIHYMKYEYKLPKTLMFITSSECLECIWENKIKIHSYENQLEFIRPNLKKVYLYTEIFKLELKEFVPEIYRFV